MGDVGEFLNEVNPKCRHGIVGDSWRLSAPRAIVVWGHADQVLLIGADNRNSFSCASKRYSEKGESSILNQETSEGIAKRNVNAE